MASQHMLSIPSTFSSTFRCRQVLDLAQLTDVSLKALKNPVSISPIPHKGTNTCVRSPRQRILWLEDGDLMDPTFGRPTVA